MSFISARKQILGDLFVGWTLSTREVLFNAFVLKHIIIIVSFLKLTIAVRNHNKLQQKKRNSFRMAGTLFCFVLFFCF